jgi:DNA modification methylase
MEIMRGDALDLLLAFDRTPDLIVTDPPYAFGGTGDEHALSATVAIVLREAATRLAKGRWMLVMCASSWRSTAYMVEAVRGILEPVRIATWCKPTSRTKTRTAGWAWASVNVVAFRKGKSIDKEATGWHLDHITAEPVLSGRRAQLPEVVADWLVQPYAVEGGLMLDPFAGSGAILHAAQANGMDAVGFERVRYGGSLNIVELEPGLSAGGGRG